MKFTLKVATAELSVSVHGGYGVLACGFLCTAWVLTTVFGFYPVMP